MEQKIHNILSFLHDLELLKSVTRHSWLSSGRQESVPEHSWRMTMMAIVLENEFPKLNMRKIIELCLVHDLGEVYDGDIPAFKKDPLKKEREAKAVKRLVKPLPGKLQNKIISLTKEYNEAKTQEAKLVKALDKLEVKIQHNEAALSTWEPLEYKFNLTYGVEQIDFHPFMKNIRLIVDDMTRKKIAKGK